MSEDHMLRVRRAIMRLAEKGDGHGVTVEFRGGPADGMAEHAVAFGRKKRLGVRVERTEQAMSLLRDDNLLASKYAAIDKLEVGQSHTFVALKDQQMSVRANVSQRGRSQGKRYACSVVPDGIKVTRIALDAPVTRGRPRVASNSREWDLGPLEQRLWVDLEPTPHQVSAVRHVIHRTQIERGWILTTRFVNGRLRVHRLDHPADGPQALLDRLQEAQPA